MRARRSYQTWVANETMEDYSLRYAPASFRKWHPFIITNTALGGISFLALEAIGAAITLSYGFSNAFAAIVIVSLVLFVVSLPIAYYSSRFNIDIDLLTRGAGFGYVGSTITSLIYACFTFIFFALEAAIMAKSLEIYFHTPILIGYLISSLVIIPITLLGVTMISRLQLVTQPIWLVMLISPFVFIFIQQPDILAKWVQFAGADGERGSFNYLFFGAATGVLLSLAVQIGEQVDYLRFLPEKTEKNRVAWWAAMIAAGPGWIVLGGLKILAGSLLAVILLERGLSPRDALEPFYMYEAAYSYVSGDAWTVLTAATVFVLISQIKINVTNAYAGSLAWSNFYSRVTHYHPGRVVWLVFNILISLLLMLLGIFQTLELVLAVYSNVAIAWIGAILADLAVLKPLRISPSFIEFKRAHLYNVNPVGCGAMAIASLVSVAAFTGVLGQVAEAYSAVLSLAIAFLTAILIGIATRGRYYIARPDELEHRKPGQKIVQCEICRYVYEASDMAHCPFYEGPICSLCCTLDAHCHDICKYPARAHATHSLLEGATPLRRRIPPDLVRRLNRFLGVFLALAVVTGAVFLLAYRMAELDENIMRPESARLLARLYIASLVVLCLGAWWIVLAHESRELVERELVSSLEKLTETRQELMQSERLATMGQVTATVSHELRNPLGTLSSSLGVLRKVLRNADEEVREELDRMQRNIRRCVRIIEELLDFSREKTFNAHTVAMDRWLPAQLEDISLPEYVALKLDLASQASVRIDSAQFRQVLVNLIQNAHQAIALRQSERPHGGTITVRTRVEGSSFVLSVEDDGCGIPEEISDQIFKPLFSTKAFGVGLGLPLVKRIVERHRGSIDVASQWGSGTIVTIRLPATDQTAMPLARAIGLD